MRALATLLLLVTSLSGCNWSERSVGSESQVGQVLAEVNGQEISVLQYRRALRKAGLAAATETVREELVEKLIARELAVQQAEEMRLQRRPNVMIELEEARRDVLARAWAAEVARTALLPGKNAGASFYASHPGLFEERRIYHLREVALPGEIAQVASVKSRLARGDSLDDVLRWLGAQEVEVKDQVVVRGAEQLPIESLPRLAQTAAGDTAIFESARGIIIYEVIEATPAPVSWEDAQPMVAAYLGKQARKRAVNAEQTHLRRNANVVYVRAIADAAPEQ